MVKCECGSRQLPTRGASGTYYCAKCHGTIHSGQAETPLPAEDLVTTLDWIPGYRVVRTLGIVSAIGANSGFTAKDKGDIADDRAQGNLRRAAAAVGANAVLRVIPSAFGAAGGITSAFGGDAVGVLYVGTAAVVEPDPGVTGAES